MDTLKIFSTGLVVAFNIIFFLFARSRGMQWNFRKNTPPCKPVYMLALSLVLITVSIILALWFTDPISATIGSVVSYASKVFFFLFVFFLGYATHYGEVESAKCEACTPVDKMEE